MRLQKKLSVALTLTALVPLVALISIALYHSTSTTEKLSLDLAQRTTQTGASHLNAYFSQRLAEISVYARSPLLASMEIPQFDRYLRAEQSRFGHEYEKFIIGFPDGREYNTASGNPAHNGVLTSNDNDPSSAPKSIQDRDFWQATIRDNVRGEEIRYISNPMISFTTGVKQIVVAATILNERGEVAGMIGGALQWSRIEALINEVHREVIREYDNEARFMIVSANGKFIYHWNPTKTVRLLRDDQGQLVKNATGDSVAVSNNITDEPYLEIAKTGAAMLKGESGITSFFDDELKLDAYLVYAPIGKTGYSVGLVLPQHLVTQPVAGLRGVFFTITLFVVAFVALSAPIISRQFINPISKLSRLTQRVANGNLTLRAPVERSDEIGILSRAFNEMIEKLELRESELRGAHLQLQTSIVEKTARLHEEVANKEAIQTQLEIECERAQRYLDVANVMLLVLRPDQSIELINRKGCELIGYDDAELIGKNWFDQCAPLDVRDTLRGEFVSVVNGRARVSPHDESNIIDREGNRRLIAWRNSEVRDSDGRLVSIISSGEDITEKSRVDQMKRDFVSVVSHELRTPLTSIRGALRLFSTVSTIQLTPEAAHLLDIANRNVERLSLLINDILDIDKIESGRMKLDFQSLNISPLVKQSIESNRAYGHQFGVSFVLNDKCRDAKANVDGAQFQQVMSNLLSNAAKFSPPNKPIAVDVERAGNKVRVSVKNDGPGIADEFKDKIFQKFSQADRSNTRSKGGTGLELSIAKALVENMGGNISFFSAQNQGTTFFFELPVIPEP